MRAITSVVGLFRHAVGAVAEAGVVVAIAVALVFGTSVVSRTDPAGAGDVFAKTSTGSISLASVDGVYSATLQPSLGDTVTFNVTVSNNVNNPRVQLMCYQGGSVVYGETGSVAQAVGDGTDPLGYSGFLLGGGGSIWKDSGGSADCVARLFYFGKKAGVQTFNVIASTAFAAGG